AGVLAHHHDLHLVRIEAVQAEPRETGRAGPQGRDLEVGEEGDRVRGLEPGECSRGCVVPEIEHYVVEVRADDLEAGPDLIAVELRPLHSLRYGRTSQPACRAGD